MNSSRLAAPLGRHVLARSRPWRCSHSVSQQTGRSRRQLGAGHACSQRQFSSVSPALQDVLHVSEEVAEAVATNKPVVALESTIYTHGAMGKGLAKEHEDLVRSCGGIPAIIAILDGVPKVGVTPQEIVRMIEHEGTVKASRRDISYLVGMVSFLHPPWSLLRWECLSANTPRAWLGARFMAAQQSQGQCYLRGWQEFASSVLAVSEACIAAGRTPWTFRRISQSWDARE